MSEKERFEGIAEMWGRQLQLPVEDMDFLIRYVKSLHEELKHKENIILDLEVEIEDLKVDLFWEKEGY